MSIISRRPSTRQTSRRPPTRALSPTDVTRIQQQNVERQRSTEEARLEPGLEPLPSQHLTPNRRTTTFQHLQQGWDKLSAVFVAGKWRAKAKHAAEKRVAESPSQIGNIEKQVPVVTGHSS